MILSRKQAWSQTALDTKLSTLGNKESQVNGYFWLGASSRINGLAISVWSMKKLIICIILVCILWCLSMIFWWIVMTSWTCFVPPMSVQDESSKHVFLIIISCVSMPKLRMQPSSNSTSNKRVILIIVSNNSQTMWSKLKLRDQGWDHRMKINSEKHQRNFIQMTAIWNASMLWSKSIKLVRLVEKHPNSFYHCNVKHMISNIHMAITEGMPVSCK